ncbi:MAG: hypothetical protein EOP48_33740, partial [Sphingobacteriales bacterium]
MDLIREGLKRNLIRFDASNRFITYVQQNKRRLYDNAEEKVQAATYLHLIITYNYSPEKIRQYVPIQMGTNIKEADIIVYEDKDFSVPLILIECKSEMSRELEFVRAGDQAWSYAVAIGVKYVWVTSGIKNEYYEISLKKNRERVIIPDIPQAGNQKIGPFKFAKDGGIANGGQKLFPLIQVTEEELTRRFQLAHQALWGGGELNPSEAFDELDK